LERDGGFHDKSKGYFICKERGHGKKPLIFASFMLGDILDRTMRPCPWAISRVRAARRAQPDWRWAIFFVCTMNGLGASQSKLNRHETQTHAQAFMIFDTSAYLLTLAVSLPLVALTWFIAGRLGWQSWPWRLVISTLLAAAIAPTASLLYGKLIVAPAIWTLRILFWNFGDISNSVSVCLTFGVFPIVLTAAIIFGCWTLFSKRPDM
jgi:hypothetical protein